MEEFVSVYHEQFALYYQTKINPTEYLNEECLHDFATIDAIEALLVFVHGPGVNKRTNGVTVAQFGRRTWNMHEDGVYVCDMMFGDLEQALFIVTRGRVSMYVYHNGNLMTIDTVPGASIAINHMERLLQQTYKRMMSCAYWPGVVDVNDYKRYMLAH